MMIGYIAIGNYGDTIRLTDAKLSPRTQLLAKLGYKHADNVYRDTPNGPKHCGYVVGKQWFEVHEVHEWEGRAKLH